jgi:hypothetical protein
MPKAIRVHSTPRICSPIAPEAEQATAGGTSPAAEAVTTTRARAQVRVDPTKPAEFNPAGFSFSFAGRGEFWTARFKLMLLGATDATDRASLAAHRCSNLL